METWMTPSAFRFSTHRVSFRAAMTRLLRPIAILMGVLALAPLALAQSSSAPIAFVGVNVIPMDRETVLTNHTVVIREGRIAELGPAARIQLASDVKQIDARGKFVLPGLTEMHGHLVGGDRALNERILLLQVLHGVTTVRVMQGHPAQLTLRERVRSGEIVGPTLYIAAPSIDGNNTPTPQAAVQAVTLAKQQGFDLLKVLEGLSRANFDAMAKTADQLGIRFGGHVPADVGVRRALEARYVTIDHLDGYFEGLVKDGANVDVQNAGVFGSAIVDSLDVAKIPEIVKLTKTSGTAVVPTQTLPANVFSKEPIEKLFARPELSYLPVAMVEGWKKQLLGMSQLAAATSPAQRERYFALRRQLIKALYDGGVPILHGSDAPQILNIPGVAALDELVLMVETGLTPYQVLRSATHDVAVHFGTTATTGTIAEGKRADLLIVEANPLQDIGNARARFGVVVNGRWLPRADIDQRLQVLQNQR
jgi:imidazolonepropionase-like amidohydrolase